MNNFIFYNPTKINFGRGVESSVGEEIKSLGASKVLFHYGGGSIRKNGLYDRILDSLNKAGLHVIELGGVKPNPRLSLVKKGIELCKNSKVDFILAVGGGSVIDSAKAIALGVPYDGDVWDFFTKNIKIEKALPLGTVLTIPAAGSESSSGTVITNEDGWYKRSTGSPLLYPKFSMLNPELCVTLPEYQIAAGSADILAHLMERYFTNTKNVELIDRLIEGTMKTVINNVPKVLKNKEDYDSFAEVMWAGTIAHNNLLSTGRETDWASHNIEHELSGIYDVTHGAGLAVIFPAWMKFVYKHDLDRFNQFATRVFDVQVEDKTKEEVALEGIKKLEEFFKSINLPVTLKELEIGEDRLEEMAKKCTDNDEHTVGHFVELNTENILEIYKLAL